MWRFLTCTFCHKYLIKLNAKLTQVHQSSILKVSLFKHGTRPPTSLRDRFTSKVRGYNSVLQRLIFMPLLSSGSHNPKLEAPALLSDA